MKKVGTGQWAGWLGAAIIAAAGGACFIALGSTGFAPGLPMIELASVKRSRDLGGADATLRRIETASLEGNRYAEERQQSELFELVSTSRAEALRLLARFETGEFDDTALSFAVLTSLMQSGHEDVVERAMDAAHRLELDRTSPRGGEEVLEAVRRAPDPREIESIAAQDLRHASLLFEIEELAQSGPTSELKVAAIRALARAEEPLVTDFLLQRLEWETSVEIRQALALSLMIRPDAMAGERLAALLSTRAEAIPVRRCAAEGLSQHGRLSVARATLVEAINREEPNDSLRLSIVNSLGAIGSDPSVEEALITALKIDPSDAVRAAAALALVGSPTVKTREALRQAIASSSSAEVRGSSEQALGMIQQMFGAGESSRNRSSQLIERK